MPADKVSWYNRIDIGIFLLFLEVCMEHKSLAFERTLFADTREEERILVAVYAIKKKSPHRDVKPKEITLDPQGYATRAEVAAMLMRFDKKLG